MLCHAEYNDIVIHAEKNADIQCHTRRDAHAMAVSCTLKHADVQCHAVIHTEKYAAKQWHAVNNGTAIQTEKIR